ncbi:MAG: hypothetical protein H7224_01320 [Polaromonas sp.]|nr:hypothetical protein [Polaromonas sp.]
MCDPVFPATPLLRIGPAFQTPEADEDQTPREMQESLLGVARTMADNTGHARRCKTARRSSDHCAMAARFMSRAAW